MAVTQNIANKVFIVNRSKLEGRLEPKFYTQKYLENINKLYSSNSIIYKISDVTSLVSDGTHFTPKYTNEGIKFVSVKDVRKSKISLENTKFISQEEADQLDKRCRPSKNDILLTKVGTIGNASLIDTEERFQIFVSVALLRPNNKILPKYLEILLNSNLIYVQFDRVLKGASVPDLHLEDIRKIKIPLPSIETQHLIISIYQNAYSQKQQKEAQAKQLLESIDTYFLTELGIALQTKKNTAKDRIFLSSFREVVGSRIDPKLYDNVTKEIKNAISNAIYPKLALKELIIQSAAGDWGIEDEETEIDGYTKCLVIRATEFDNKGNLNLDNSRVKYRLIKKEKLKSIDVKAGDLLIEKSGGSTDQPVGRIAIITKEYLENNYLGYSNFIHKIRLDETKILPDYAFYFLKAVHNIKLTDAMQSQTNGIRNLIMSNYFNQKIVLPTIKKQDEIVKHIKHIQQQITKLKSDATSILENAKAEVEKMILG